MSSFKRIISLVCTFAISISLLLVPASATIYQSTGTFWNWLYDHSPSWEGTAIALVSQSVCLKSGNGYHTGSEVTGCNANGTYNVTCDYCGETFLVTDEECGTAYSTYVSTLDYSMVTSGVSGSSYNGFVLSRLPDYDESRYPYAYLCDASVLEGEAAYSFHIASSAPKWKSLYDGWKYYGWNSGYYQRWYFFPGKDSAFWLCNDHSTGLDSNIVFNIMSDDKKQTPVWCNTDVLNEDGSVFLSASLFTDVVNYEDESAPVATSRPLTVNGNYGIIGNDGTVVNVYNTVPYDEETLIFTEPQTGTQYQTTGWTYDYTNRYYKAS